MSIHVSLFPPIAQNYTLLLFFTSTGSSRILWQYGLAFESKFAPKCEHQAALGLERETSNAEEATKLIASNMSEENCMLLANIYGILTRR